MPTAIQNNDVRSIKRSLKPAIKMVKSFWSFSRTNLFCSVNAGIGEKEVKETDHAALLLSVL